MQELADKVGLSVSPCHRRVKLLEERGVISRYVATVDQKALGLHVSVFISIKLARQKEEDLNRFARAISKWDEVLECYLMTGNRDYLLRVVAADLASYESFPEDQADPARRHRLDRVELCAQPGQIFDRAAGLTAPCRAISEPVSHGRNKPRRWSRVTGTLPKEGPMTASYRTPEMAKRERIIREMTDDLDEELEMELDDSGSTSCWTRPTRSARRWIAGSISRSCCACRASW